jgi:cyclic dehypoxanthinyl futalosine synthase
MMLFYYFYIHGGKMKVDIIVQKALDQEFLVKEEAMYIYTRLPLEEIMWTGNEMRKLKNPGNEVGWIIDRNVNITNICSARCKFCNFHRIKKDGDTYITSMEEYREKIAGLYAAGGKQLLLQGGLNPDLGQPRRGGQGQTNAPEAHHPGQWR